MQPMHADLHMHSCLSPCASLENSPRDIVQQALNCNLQILALTDHNSAKNTPAFCSWAEKLGVLAFPGIELTSQEEVHIISIYPDLDRALDMSDFIEKHILKIPHKPQQLGDQVVVNADNEIIEEVDFFLGSAIQLGLDDLFVEVKKRGALFIPAHIFRPMYSMTSQLGFIPDMDYDALEITRKKEGFFTDTPVLASSDTHYLDDIGRRYTQFLSPVESFEDLVHVLKQNKVNPVL